MTFFADYVNCQPPELLLKKQLSTASGKYNCSVVQVKSETRDSGNATTIEGQQLRKTLARITNPADQTRSLRSKQGTILVSITYAARLHTANLAE
jgi:hypothetical protein